MKNITGMTETMKPKDFEKAITRTAFMSDVYRDLVKAFCFEMHNALTGRICTRERMAKLYPIFREINIEQEEAL